MNLTNESMVPLTIHGIPSGNYDGTSTSFISDSVIAADYYPGQGSIQTATLTLTEFVGKIKIQATLDDRADTVAWAEVDSFGDATTAETGIFSLTILGNFVYVRAEITDFTSGTIDSISLTY
jgi:hypothetical protein